MYIYKGNKIAELTYYNLRCGKPNLTETESTKAEGVPYHEAVECCT